MKIHVKSTNLDLTPSLTIYIENKLGALARFVKRFDREGVAAIWLEVGRTTRHHHKGQVFRAEADLRLPGKILRAVEENTDIRKAIDIMKHKLQLEIEKYKTRFGKRPRKSIRSRTQD